MDEPIREETAPPPPQMRQPDNTYLTVDPYDHSHNNIEIIRPAYQKDKSIFYNNDYYAYQLISCHHNIMKGSSLLPWEADPEINDTDVSTESTEEFEDEFSDSFEEGNKREKDHPRDASVSKIRREERKTNLREKFKSEFPDFFITITKRAVNNNPIAQLNRGMMYNHGYWVNKNPELAWLCFYEAANQRVREAYRYLGEMHEKREIKKGSLFIPEAYSTAEKCYQLAASYGDKHAATWLDIQESQKLKLESETITTEISELAQKLEKLKRDLIVTQHKQSNLNNSIFFKAAKEAVEKGQIPSIVPLGHHYLYGRGCIEDHKSAWDYFKFAASLRDIQGVTFLGIMHEEKKVQADFDVPEQYNTAKKCYEIAAYHGDKMAQERLDRLFPYREEYAEKTYDQSYESDQSDQSAQGDQSVKNKKRAPAQGDPFPRNNKRTRTD